MTGFDLLPDELVLSSTPNSGFYASDRPDLAPGGGELVLTNRRLLLVRTKGTFRKQSLVSYEKGLQDFVNRINRSQGQALGSGARFVTTMFTTDEETVSVGFGSITECDHFAVLAANAIEPHLPAS